MVLKKLRDETKSMIINLALSIVAGYASWNVHVHSFSAYGSLRGFLVGLAFFALVSFLIKLNIGKKDLRWIMNNGGWYFWAGWFITWTLFFNILAP